MHALNRKDAVVNFVDVSFVLDVRREGRMVGTPWAPVRVDPVTIHNMILQLLRVGKVFTTHDANVQLLVKPPVMAHKFALGFEGFIFVRTIFVQKGKCSPFLELTPTL